MARALLRAGYIADARKWQTPKIIYNRHALLSETLHVCLCSATTNKAGTQAESVSNSKGRTWKRYSLMAIAIDM